MKHGTARYNLTIESLPDDVPATIRLRMILKALLRSYRFKCLDVADVTTCPPIAKTGPSQLPDTPR